MSNDFIINTVVKKIVMQIMRRKHTCELEVSGLLFPSEHVSLVPHSGFIEPQSSTDSYKKSEILMTAFKSSPNYNKFRSTSPD